jgi:hypothetical protein
MTEYNDNSSQPEEILTTGSRRHRKPKGDNMLPFRNVLNIIFMLLALAGVVVYLWVDDTVGTYMVLAAMVIKMVECCIRMIK